MRSCPGTTMQGHLRKYVHTQKNWATLVEGVLSGALPPTGPGNGGSAELRDQHLCMRCPGRQGLAVAVCSVAALKLILLRSIC